MAAAKDSKTDPAKLSYEEARDELAKVVATLESGQATLEQSLALWERGEELAKICQQWLDGAKAKLAAAKPESEK
jgi:exodeoxyribonuclease VII small subunit